MKEERNHASLVGPPSQGVCLTSMLRKAMFQDKKGMGISRPRVSVDLGRSALWVGRCIFLSDTHL